MSFSLIHALNSLTAKAADTPEQRENPVCHNLTQRAITGVKSSERLLTLFDEVLVEEAVQDGGRYVAVGQQDAGQHGQFVALRLRESFEKQQQLETEKSQQVY